MNLPHGFVWTVEFLLLSTKLLKTQESYPFLIYFTTPTEEITELEIIWPYENLHEPNYGLSKILISFVYLSFPSL